MGSNIFLASEVPRYWTGYGLSAGFLVLAIGCTVLLRFVLMRENQRRDQLTESDVRDKYTEGKSNFRSKNLRDLRSYTDLDEDELLDLGDKSPLYRYVY